MSAVKTKGPLVDPGICRCCGSTKKCRILTAEYDFQGNKEVYSDMILDCFGLVLSHLEGKVTERLICATCVVRLREAKDFRRQVLQCEEAFLQMKIYDCEPPEMAVTLIKNEVKEPTSDNDSVGRGSHGIPDTDRIGEDFKTEDLDYSSNDDLPLKRRRSKKQNVKIKPRTRQNKTKKNASTGSVKKFAKSSRIHPLVKQELMKRRNSLQIMNRQKAIEQHKLMLKMQQDARDKDKSFMIGNNVTIIIENSYVCPFRCRHNNLHCYYCREHFTDPEELRQHTSKHSLKKFYISEFRTTIKIDITNIDCRLCTQKINDLESFKFHITEMHGKKFYTDIPDFVLPFRLTKDCLNCVVCDKTFMYFHAINQHMNEHYNNYVCETCGLGFVDQSRLIMHKAKHDTGVYPCEVCGKTFKSDAYRELHVDRVHKKLGKVYCPKCDVRLMSYYQKLKHLVEVHGEQPLRFECTSCDKIFESRRGLTLHQRKYHIKDFRYECEYCGQKFFTRFSLKNHLPTHTGERNFKCKICEKSYPRLKTLKDHIRIHTNDRRYRCHICGQAFIQNCSLKGHMRSQHPEYTWDTQKVLR